jgi:hypothetical protein
MMSQEFRGGKRWRGIICRAMPPRLKRILWALVPLSGGGMMG